jgi:hypothetical protein
MQKAQCKIFVLTLAGAAKVLLAQFQNRANPFKYLFAVKNRARFFNKSV